MVDGLYLTIICKENGRLPVALFRTIVQPQIPFYVHLWSDIMTERAIR